MGHIAYSKRNKQVLTNCIVPYPLEPGDVEFEVNERGFIKVAVDGTSFKGTVEQFKDLISKPSASQPSNTVYFLLGEIAVRTYRMGGAGQVISQNIPYKVSAFTEKVTDVAQLLNLVFSYRFYVNITESEFNLLSE